jgi:hypothetical protein
VTTAFLSAQCVVKVSFSKYLLVVHYRFVEETKFHTRDLYREYRTLYWSTKYRESLLQYLLSVKVQIETVKGLDFVTSTYRVRGTITTVQAICTETCEGILWK